ncbi:unnamed protein product [Rhizophagus irregularis]|nr:unnamed protein product [Rhizophagus irregularis]
MDFINSLQDLFCKSQHIQQYLSSASILIGGAYDDQVCKIITYFLIRFIDTMPKQTFDFIKKSTLSSSVPPAKTRIG